MFIPEVHDDEECIRPAFYNPDNYDNPQAAQKLGALYKTNSEISLYGMSGLHDLYDITHTASKCLGLSLCLAIWHQGEYVDAEDIFKQQNDIERKAYKKV